MLLETFHLPEIFYRDMKCGRICLSHGGQLPVLHRRKGSQHFMNQAKFHSTFPILLLLKSLPKIRFLEISMDIQNFQNTVKNCINTSKVVL